MLVAALITRMFVLSSAVEVDSDGRRAAHQRLGLRQTVRGLQQLSQNVELSRDSRVFGSVGLLVDGPQRSKPQTQA